MSEEITPEQKVSYDKLVKKGFRFNRWSSSSCDEDAKSIFMSKKPTHYSTLYAVVEIDGSVNGMTLEEFLAD